MARSPSLPSRLVLMLAAEMVIGALAGLIAANAVMRPGCSLPPPGVPEEAIGRSVPISAAQACRIIGRPLPVVRVPDGVALVGLSAGIGAPARAGMVRMTFAKGARNVATLDLARVGIPRGNLRVNNTVGTMPADVATALVADGNFVDVGYHWFRDEMMFTLHIALVDGITRTAADDMAASIH